MAFSLYDATVVHLLLGLDTLDHILDVAEKQPNAESLLKASLYEDMKPLTFQVHSVTRHSEKILARLSGKESVEFEDELVSFADLHARIAKVREALQKADKDEINRQGEEVAPTPLPSAGTMNITGKAYAMGAAIPNIDFHLAIAYAILRKEGVPLGKRDFIMPYVNEHILKGQ
ncbi:hypothetical protein S7711_03151 [Stachybotrys chartarum IBT 7711]|uniref:DUF1993 domain-containing protein n=1 Tax=Stachybotrys chartarum (strain CBS 109288 / IBT 7711) TaxID=1280523 RepID=A0A084AWI8_STACB|nr:hypothetical protein S7711_03151 [Stachybotrys chartarum IBT 7711]KFA49345.1 hypothetical protein S40293_04194 [Stachybotrys chartarum IBT 40293]KFA80493.1 hypothetical protein S40288_02091 [Stachybotrys chartarum IBT 40288]